MKFELGSVVATRNAAEFMEVHGVNPLHLLLRHVNGDWGDLDDEDKAANDLALTTGARIFSCYEVEGSKLYVITEAMNDDGLRASTCVMLPEDY